MSESDPFDNPLKEDMLKILESFPLGLSEFELILKLKERTSLVPDDYGEDSFRLFQTHFRVFNGLYQLQQELSNLGERCIDISALNIRIRACNEPIDEQALDDGHEAKLAAYYLDIKNLEEATPEGVESMLSDFWARFDSLKERKQALEVLDLEEGSNYEEIRKRYRELAREHHPDRGGEKERLQEINEAMAVLERFCGPGKSKL